MKLLSIDVVCQLKLLNLMLEIRLIRPSPNSGMMLSPLCPVEFTIFFPHGSRAKLFGRADPWVLPSNLLSSAIHWEPVPINRAVG